MKTIGLDFGTESARGVLVDVDTGNELDTHTVEYANGVIEGKYHDPNDYVSAFQKILEKLQPADAIGVAATSCSVLPCKADGTPLSQLTKNPHAFVKIWKNHDAQPQADLINQVAARRGEKWFARYGKISSEWFFPKVLHTLVEAPDLYKSADRFIEKADWIVWQLTGKETRNSCCAGYKAMWHKKEGFPPREFFAALNSDFADVVDRKMSRAIFPVGSRAGTWHGIPVAVGNIDAHAAVPAAGVEKPGTMVLVMGTSICHMLLGDKEAQVRGMCGVVEDGILPGWFGYESGQSAGGDMLAWLTREFNLPHESSKEPGGLVALDWLNGSRELQNANLSGLVVGLNLETQPSQVYRALIESIAFGTRRIIESYEKAGISIRELRACGGLAYQNKLLMQIFADVTGRTIRVVRSRYATAIGAAMFGAMAAGISTSKIGGVSDMVFEPDSSRREKYGKLYEIYTKLHNTFSDGRLMAALREL